MSRKDYKQGAADTMNAYEAFAKKQEAATRHVGEQIGNLSKDVEQLGKSVEFISDYITDKEKQALYKANMPVDIADLEETDKYLLVCVLYKLAQQEPPTEEQKNYIRAVQKYLMVRDVQIDIDLDVVENIPDTATIIAVMQAVMEYFYLGTHPGAYTEEELDFLDLFMANRKTRKDIMARIKNIVNAVGKEGLAEKYGFVPEENDEPEEDEVTNSVQSESIAEEIADEIKLHRYTITKDYIVANIPHYSFTSLLDIWSDDTNKPKGSFYVWEKQTKKLTTFDIPEWNDVDTMHSCGNLLLLGSRNQKGICVYDIDTKQQRIVCNDYSSRHGFSVDHDIIAYMNNEDYLMVYNLTSKKKTYVKELGYTIGHHNFTLHNKKLFYLNCQDNTFVLYDIETNTESKLFEKSGFTIEQIIPYHNKIYVFLYSVYEHYVVLQSIDVSNPLDAPVEHFSFSTDSSYGIDSQVQIAPYFIYVKPEYKFPVYSFNMNNESLEQVTSGCGHAYYDKGSLFKKSSTTYLLNNFQVVGDYLYFKYDDESNVSRISLVNPGEGITKIESK